MATFVEMYKAAVAAPTPRQVFIADIARVTGVPQQTVEGWCAGKHYPSCAARGKIAAYLGVAVEELFPAKRRQRQVFPKWK